PTASQTASTRKGDPRSLVIPAGVRKIPTPMISATTSAAAVSRPSPGDAAGACAEGFLPPQVSMVWGRLRKRHTQRAPEIGGLAAISRGKRTHAGTSSRSWSEINYFQMVTGTSPQSPLHVGAGETAAGCA